jgi:tRNA A-37 threonylcarbamoyl transferase component Bud32
MISQNLSAATNKIFGDKETLREYLSSIPALHEVFPTASTGDHEMVVEKIAGGVTNSILRLKLHGSTIIAKLYTERYMLGDSTTEGLSPDWGRSEYEIIKLLQAPGSRVDVPEPYYFDHSLNVLFMKDCAYEGSRSFIDSLATMDPQGSVPESVGIWICHLHHNSSLAKKITFWERQDIYRFTLDYQIACARKQMKKFSISESQLSRLISDTGSSKKVLLHGNLCPKNVLLHRDKRITLLDFESSALGDAAYDIGYFLAHYLIERARGLCDERYVILAWEKFLQSYLRPDGEDSDSLLRRFFPWCGVALLYRSCHLSNLFLQQDEELSNKLAEMGFALFSFESPPKANVSKTATEVIEKIGSL